MCIRDRLRGEGFRGSAGADYGGGKADRAGGEGDQDRDSHDIILPGCAARIIQYQMILKMRGVPAPAKCTGKAENQEQVSHFPLPLRDDNCGFDLPKLGSLRLLKPPLRGAKRNTSPASNASSFQDHLVLESKSDFRIILQLENAGRVGDRFGCPSRSGSIATPAERRIPGCGRAREPDFRWRAESGARSDSAPAWRAWRSR